MKHLSQTKSVVPFAALAVLFVGNQIAQHLQIATHFTSAYLDDLLCLPIVLFIVQWVQRRVHQRDAVLPYSHVVVSFVFFSLLFEVVLPRLSVRYVSDYRDVLFYAAGALIFCILNGSGGTGRIAFPSLLKRIAENDPPGGTAGILP